MSRGVKFIPPSHLAGEGEIAEWKRGEINRRQREQYHKKKALGEAWHQKNPERHRASALRQARLRKEQKRIYDMAYKAKNGDAIREHQRNRYRSDPEEFRRRSTRTRLKRDKRTKRDIEMRSTYGVGMDWWDAQIEKQGGCCALCWKPLDGIEPSKRTVLDHCHKTGLARAILHNRCNVALGFYESGAGKYEEYLRVYGHDEAKTA